MVPTSKSLVCSINLETGGRGGKWGGASPLRHKIDFLAFFTVEFTLTQYSHGITQSFSLWQYPQLCVLHILLPRQSAHCFPRAHKPKPAPSPYGLGELFWWLQVLPDALFVLAGWGTAKLTHQGCWSGCLAVRICRLWRATGSLEKILKSPGKAVLETNFLSKRAGKEPPLSPGPSWRENKGNTSQQGFEIRYPTLGQGEGADPITDHICH